MILRLLLPLTALALLGVTAPLPAPTPEQALAARTVQAHVEFLADDRLEGRDTGSRGHEIAANYVASQFRQLGLEPGGPDGSWFQQVPLRRATTVQPTLTRGRLTRRHPALFVSRQVPGCRSHDHSNAKVAPSARESGAAHRRAARPAWRR